MRHGSRGGQHGRWEAAGAAWKSYLAGLVSIAIQGAALAQPPIKPLVESIESTVRIGDLDLGSGAGERQARERIHKAAIRLCNRLGNPSRVDDLATAADCVRGAEVAALERLHRLTVRLAAAEDH